MKLINIYSDVKTRKIKLIFCFVVWEKWTFMIAAIKKKLIKFRGKFRCPMISVDSHKTNAQIID